MNEEISIEEGTANAFDDWQSTWNLTNMTMRDVFAAGFEHGINFAKSQSVTEVSS